MMKPSFPLLSSLSSLPSLIASRRLIKITLALALLFSLAVSQASAVPGRIEPNPVENTAQQEFFEKKIRPILATSCQRCHNSKAKVAGLDLTTAEGFHRGGDSGLLVNKENRKRAACSKSSLTTAR